MDDLAQAKWVVHAAFLVKHSHCLVITILGSGNADDQRCLTVGFLDEDRSATVSPESIAVSDTDLTLPTNCSV